MGSSWSWVHAPRRILWTVGWGWGRPGLTDAVDDMSVANLDPDHDGLITGKPTLDEAT